MRRTPLRALGVGARGPRPMARKTRRERWFARYAARAVLVLFLLASLAWAGHDLPTRLRALPLFSVQHVEVVGANLSEVGELARAAGLAMRARVGQLDLQTAAGRLLALPMVEDAQLSWLPPDGVRIRVIERKPVAVVSVDARYGVDRDLWCFPLPLTARVEDLPVITGVAPAAVTGGGRSAEPALKEAVRVVEALTALEPALAAQVTEVAMTPEGADLVLVDGRRRVRLGRDRYESKLRVVRAVLDDLAHRGETFEEIDARFEDYRRGARSWSHLRRGP